jgi:hypothetical protein
MGQYFMPVNETKKEYFDAYDIDGGEKLLEWILNLYECGTFTLLLMDKWKNDKITLVGEYDKSGLYNYAEEKFKDISKNVVKIKNEQFENFIKSKDKYVFVNEDDKTFVSGSSKQISRAVPILLMESNEDGGDIENYESNEIAGKFAGKNVFVSKKNEFNTNKYTDMTKDLFGTKK